MTENSNQPKDHDAVLGRQIAAPTGSVVLGGLFGVKRRFASEVVPQRAAVLSEALNYGQEGLELVIQALLDEAEQVRQTAYILLQPLRTQPHVGKALDDFQYLSLRQLLAAGKWKEADQETTAVMLRICKCKKAGYLNVEDIETFPCSDLSIIDNLWLEYSQGRFGFSVQSHIWQTIGGNSNPDWNAWCRFGKQVGWYVKESWLWWNDLTFSLHAPVGHLPRGGAFIGWGLGDFWTGCRVFSALSLRLVQCDLP
ncbi:MAG TPA: GUN4 domain-containing protein [Coleofasciculaceae cyanobacterium]|jgi:hypothetical protein